MAEHPARRRFLARAAAFAAAGPALGRPASAQQTNLVPTPAQIADMDRISQAYRSSNHVPGLTVAIAKNGRLVFRKAYGWADVQNRWEAKPFTLFRIASVSKPFTSTAIYKIIEDSGGTSLKLGDTVFGRRGVLSQFRLPRLHNDWLQEIQVSDLLTHTGGGWSNDGNDPMFQHFNMDHQQLIQHTLLTHPLQNPPGAKYAYSNFGYCVLGRVIEKITNVSYAQYVQRAVLEPLGIHDMRIAANTIRGRARNEATYYGQGSYEYNVTRMDSHGGWIATASDLVQFALHDVGKGQPPLLSPTDVESQTTGTKANESYAKGWMLNHPNVFHSGLLDGTASVLVSTGSDLVWAAIVNHAFIGGKPDPGSAIDDYMWKMASAVPQWQVHSDGA